MSTVLERLSYTHDKFVNREEAIGIVMEKARRIAEGLPVERRVVIFHGQRGSGKSWLLQELQLGLRQYLTPHLVVLSKQTKVSDIKTRRPPEQSLALLVDDVNEADEELLEVLEEQVLAPLVGETNVLIVLAERGRPHYWNTPDFREKSDEFDLQPFDLNDMREQIERQIPGAVQHAEEIGWFSGGYPWSTYILACLFPDVAKALEHLVNLFFEGVENEEELCRYAEALSILRAFDETRMQPILQTYAPEFADRTRGYAACRKIREDLVTTTLARWDENARGYVLDEPIRLVTEAALCERDRKLWVRLHCAAYRLYVDWAEKYEQSRAWWTSEAQHHERRLELDGRSPADCESSQKEGEHDHR